MSLFIALHFRFTPKSHIESGNPQSEKGAHPPSQMLWHQVARGSRERKHTIPLPRSQGRLVWSRLQPGIGDTAVRLLCSWQNRLVNCRMADFVTLNYAYRRN